MMNDNAFISATLDHLLHHAETIIMIGKSYRTKKRLKVGLVPTIATIFC